MASRPSRFLKGPVAVTCTIALASALSLPPVALAASDGSSLDAGEARITLQSNGRMLKFDQALINQVGLQHTGGSCLGYAAAYAKTITTGTVHTWAEFDYNGGAYGESGFCGKNMTDEFDCRVIGSESEVLRTLYNAINDGHPVVLYVTTGSGSQHWVTVIGYEGVDNPDNLSTDNFIILDPDRTSGLEPESLSSRGLTLRYGDWMGNVRISYASADVDDGRVPSEHFSDCFYGDWFAYNFGNKDTYYYRGAYMDVVRSIDFICSRDKAQKDNIFMTGGSQGGAFTIAGAALDNRLNAIAPSIQFMGDFPDYFQVGAWPASVAKAKQNELGMDDEQMYRFLSYFDTKNLATLVTCPVITAIGLQDPICPPHTNFAPYNNLKVGDRQYVVNTECQHETPAEWYNICMDFFKAHMNAGGTDGISDTTTADDAATDGQAYNLSGMRVGNDHKGIVIVDGKKYLWK